MKSCIVTVLFLSLAYFVDPICANDSAFHREPNSQLHNHILNSRFEVKRITDRLQNLRRITPSKLVGKSSITMQSILKTDIPQYLTEWKASKAIKNSRTKILQRNMFKYALSVTAIGAGTALLEDFSKTGEIRPHKALDFLSDSNFFKSSAGIFVGSTMLSALGNFLPPSISPILKTFPGFFGAALGFEWSQGKIQELDWVRESISALASSAAFVALGSGGILAIAGGVVASILSDQIYDKLFDQNLAKSKTPNFESDKLKPSENTVTSKQSSVKPELLIQIQHNASQNNFEELKRNLDQLTVESATN